MSRLTTLRCLAAVCLAGATVIVPAAAQQGRWASLPSVTDDSLERLRLAQILGQQDPDGFLLRSASTLLGASTPTSRHWTVFRPELNVTINSAIPFSMNDGSMWAGRGRSHLIRVGGSARFARAWLVVAPEWGYSRNSVFTGPDQPPHSHPLPAGRNPFSSPWHTVPLSADLPVRFGNNRFTYLDPGQSSLGVDAGPVDVGVGTENLWWGPGIRNAIVMSNNAAGFPHAFLRTARPVATRAGWFEGTWIIGGLSESRFFDGNAANDLRSIAGLAFTWRLRWAPGLTVGATRAVYAPVSSWGAAVPRIFNVFARTGRPNARPTSDSTMTPGRDQVYSVFARWIFPDEGLETYAEWSRTEFPSSLREWFTAPNHTQGFTVGFQWARPLPAATLRLQAEMTYLEHDPTFRDQPQGTYYTSRSVEQGYTQRGQVIGAAIGPGASSQWLGVDYVAKTWSVGLVGTRVRWENDALYDLPDGRTNGLIYCSHDVSLMGGVRSAWASPVGKLETSVLTGPRYNMFFRNFGAPACGVPLAGGDVSNTMLGMRFVPAW